MFDVFLQDFEQAMFAMVAQDDVDAFDAGNLRSFVLSEASNHGDDGVGVLSDGLTDGVAAFFFGHAGDGAGVYDVDVGFFMIGYKVKPC